VYAGERVAHAIMGIMYGAMLASLVPTLAKGEALGYDQTEKAVSIPGTDSTLFSDFSEACSPKPLEF